MKPFFFFLCFLFLFGCEKATKYNSSPRDNFEALWRIMDENYCFFAFKDVDWDDVYDRYNLLVKDTMNQYELFDILGKMLAEVKDGHTNLISSFDMSRYWAWYEDYPANFYKEIQDNYLGTDYKIAGGMKYKRLADDQIGYVYYGSFSSGVGENNLDYMFAHFKECKGLIFDVRDNGGGSMLYSDRIASRFLEERILTGYTQYKKGNGHNDFTQPNPVYLSPSDRTSIPNSVCCLFTSRTGQAEKRTLHPFGNSELKGRPLPPPVRSPMTVTCGRRRITLTKSFVAL